MKKQLLSIVLFAFFLNSIAVFAQLEFVNATYDFGIKATNIATNDMQDVYNNWKTNFVASCPNNRYRVQFDDPNFTVSEGIAYGMLLSVYANDQAVFDGLWLYYLDFVNTNGVMNWKIQGCTTVDGQNGATDAELDAAFALIVADKRWGNDGAINYQSAANTLIAAIKNYEVEAGTNVLKPGDMWGGSANTNPSYFATGYFRAFGAYTNDATFWNAVADECYAIINANLTRNNAAYNFVSDWTEADGDYSTQVPWAFNQGQSYYYDAARTPWRAAIDYVWYGHADALAYLNLCNDFVSSVNGFDNIYPGYNQDGTAINTTYKDPTFTGAYALAAMSSTDQNYVNDGYAVLKNQATTAYFGATLRAIYMFGMSGNLFNALTETTLSSLEFDQVSNIVFYPNPVKDNLTINFRTLENRVLHLYDISGKRVLNTETNALETTLDLSELKAGIYFLKTGSYNAKVIKQ